MPSKSLRLLLVLACLVLLPTSALLAGQAAPLTTQERAVHLLNRLGYGPGPGDLQALLAKGEEAWLREQLHPESLPEAPELAEALAGMQNLDMPLADLYRAYGPPAQRAVKGSKEAQQDLRRKAGQVLQEAQRARLLRAVLSRRQLEQTLTEFWFDHFNVFSGKGPLGLMLADYEQNAIRPHVLGRFRELLGAVAHHPAMLFYLDNWMNSAPGAKGSRGRFAGLNENYARELLELHTLGVDGGYTQNDVRELARVLTGLGLERGERYAAAFDDNRHDTGQKIVLGRSFPAPGQVPGRQEVEDALDMLARHPSTAHFVAFKLARRFVADEPPKPLVDHLAKVFHGTDGDLRAVMEALVKSREFWRREHFQARFKTPWRQVVSGLRAAGVVPGGGRPALSALGQMGQPVYGWLTPDGYKDTQAAWLSPDAVLRRVELAAGLAAAMQPRGGKGQPVLPPAEARLRETLGPTLSPRTLEAVAAAPEGQRPALILGGPDFMRH